MQRFTPLLADAAGPCRHTVGDRWFVDETYVKVAGRWRYVYRAVDQYGQIIDVYVSPRRDFLAARRFFATALRAHGEPIEVVTDRAPALRAAIEGLIPAAFHNTEQYANNRVECDHGRLKARLRPMRGLKRDHTAGDHARSRAHAEHPPRPLRTRRRRAPTPADRDRVQRTRPHDLNPLAAPHEAQQHQRVAVRLLALRELKRRWRATVVLALLVGIVGALVLAALAGARRSDSALARFTATTRSADVSLLPAFLYRPTAAEAEALRRVPQVDEIAVLQQYAITLVGTPPTVAPSASVDGAIDYVIDRSQLLEGRRPNPKAVDEVAIGETLSKQLHQGVGGHIDATSYSQKQLLHYAPLPGPYPLGDGPRLRFRIVGIVRHRLDLGVYSATGGVLVLTPAFDHEYANRIGQYGAIIRVRTKHGASDLPAVLAAAKRIFAKSGPVSTQGVSNETQGAGSAIDVVTLALRIFAAVAAIAGTITIGIMLSREANLAGVDNGTLRTLGLTRRQRVSPARRVCSPLPPEGRCSRSSARSRCHHDSRSALPVGPIPTSGFTSTG